MSTWLGWKRKACSFPVITLNHPKATQMAILYTHISPAVKSRGLPNKQPGGRGALGFFSKMNLLTMCIAPTAFLTVCGGVKANTSHSQIWDLNEHQCLLESNSQTWAYNKHMLVASRELFEDEVPNFHIPEVKTTHKTPHTTPHITFYMSTYFLILWRKTFLMKSRQNLMLAETSLRMNNYGT